MTHKMVARRALFGRSIVANTGSRWEGISIGPEGVQYVDEAAAIAAIQHAQECEEEALFLVTGAHQLGRVAATKSKKLASALLDIELALRCGRERGHYTNLPRHRDEVLQTLTRFALGARRTVAMQYDWTTGVFEETLKLMEGSATIPESSICFGVEGQRSTFKRFLRRLQILLHSGLQSRGEWTRFITREMPLQRQLWAEECNQLQFNSTKLKEWHVPEAVRPGIIASSIRKIGFDVFDLRGSAATRIRHLGPLVGDQRAADSAGFELDNLVESECQETALGREISTLLLLSRTHDCVAEIRAAGNSGISPRFDIIGSVTGRITMRSPGLQWIKKDARSILSVRPGHRIIYPDYKSFEPRVLAAAACDDALKDACKGDLYTMIADALELSGEHRRTTAKSLFLADLYGRSTNNSARALARASGTPIKVAKPKFRAIWRDLFPLSRKFRLALETRARQSGFVATSCGNRRALRKDEVRLALNHFLQGTGANIAKSALSDILNLTPKPDLLVPMHDGFVFSVSEASIAALKEVIPRTMQEAFAKYFPGNSIDVTVEMEF